MKTHDSLKHCKGVKPAESDSGVPANDFYK